MTTPELPALGVGAVYSAALEPLLQAHGELFDVLEIEPQTVWTLTGDEAEPYRVAEELWDHLCSLPGHKLVHSIGAPVGGTVRPSPAHLELLRESVERFEAPWASEHLAFNATPEFETGFFLPPRQTTRGVANSVAAVRDLRESLGVPIAIETPVNYLRLRDDEMPDGEFVAAVAEGADCGVLLDLHNIWANELNGRHSVSDYLSCLPLDRVWEIHLAGGFEMDGFWLDAHSGAVPEPLFELASEVVARLPSLRAINFEIFPSFIPVVGFELIREQMERLRELWLLAGTNANGASRQPVDRRRGPSESVSPVQWERALGALAIGQIPDDGVGLADDPGIPLVTKMINEFRASMVVNVFRLTSRFLMLALGDEAFRVILGDFWSKAPPHTYASAEAREFAAYLEQLGLRVPRLLDVLRYEQAVLETLTDNETRVVSFDFDPIPLLRALAEGRLPEVPGQEMAFEIEITADGDLEVSGTGSQDPQTFPYH